MLTKRELRDIRWLMIAKLKEIDEKILKSNIDEDLQNLKEDRREYERLFMKIDNIIQHEKDGSINKTILLSNQTNCCNKTKKIIELAC
jgi:hypothetical protein